MQSTIVEHQAARAPTWVELPRSKYGIMYSYPKHTTTGRPKGRNPLSAKNVFNIKHRLKKKAPTSPSPFEKMISTLNMVTQRANLPEGTAVMYIREIFEPGDSEFGFLGAYINATQLTQEQVNRLRIMVLPERREKILISYLDYYERASREEHVFNDSSDVLKHFDGFKRRYSFTKTWEEKLDLLFGFSFAVKKYSGWMYKYDGARERQQLIGALGRHWRNLLRDASPQQLGLDVEFSYAALLTFLQGFKKQVESIKTFDDQSIRFAFDSSELQIPHDTDNSCSTSDESSVSTLTMSVYTRASF